MQRLYIAGVLTEKLDTLVHRGDAETLAMLSVLFPAHAFPAMSGDHCVYCHGSFDLRSTSTCSIDHESDDWERVYKDSSGSEWETRCNQCHQFLQQHSASYDCFCDETEGYCYQGPHRKEKHHLLEVMKWKGIPKGGTRDQFAELDCNECITMAVKAGLTGFTGEEDEDEDAKPPANKKRKHDVVDLS